MRRPYRLNLGRWHRLLHHHRKIYSKHFFELAGDMPIEVEFVVSDAEAQSLLNLVKQQN